MNFLLKNFMEENLRPTYLSEVVTIQKSIFSFGLVVPGNPLYLYTLKEQKVSHIPGEREKLELVWSQSTTNKKQERL